MAIAGKEIESTPFLSIHSYRLLVGLLLMFSFFCSISMRADLGMAIVCMVNSTAYLKNDDRIAVQRTSELPYTSDDHPECKGMDVAEILVDQGYKGDILWTPKMQSLLFSANHYGAVISVLPAGLFADLFNPKLGLLIAIGDMALVTLLTPLLARLNFYIFFIARIFLGLGEGCVMPAMTSMSARWFPATERSTAVAFYTSGNQIAASTVYWIGAVLCSVDWLNGWPLIFYLFGTISIVWMILWSVFISNTPSENRWITVKEKNYLNASLGNPEKKLSHGPVPWRDIFRSLPVFANLVMLFSTNFTIIMLQAFLPTYFKDVLLIDTKKNGFFTTLPFFVQFVMKNVLGIASDQLKIRKILSPTVACKLFQVTGSLIQAVTLLVLAFFVDCTTPLLALTMLIIQGAAGSSVTPGAITSCLSIAPHYSGLMISMGMLSGQIGMTIAPNLIALIRKNGTAEEWTWIFIVTAFINTASATFFAIFASGQEQPWAKQRSTVYGDNSQQRQK